MLKQRLIQIIQSKPEIIQFAKDRKFEEAWIINAGQPPTETQIQAYLRKGPFQVLIVEYIWNPDDDDKRFVFTVFLDHQCKLDNPQTFINLTLKSFYDYSSFTNLISMLDTQVVGHEYLFEYPVEAVNLSVFNHWLSVGPVDLWKSGDELDFKQISSKIKARPEIEKTKLNYQGLFFRFNLNGTLNGPYYGIKTPCCDKQDSNWVINFKKINYWMKLMLNI